MRETTLDWLTSPSDHASNHNSIWMLLNNASQSFCVIFHQGEITIHFWMQTFILNKTNVIIHVRSLFVITSKISTLLI